MPAATTEIAMKIEKEAPLATAAEAADESAVQQRVWQKPRLRRLATSSAEGAGGVGPDAEVFS
jgi:hypothetical protein